MSHLLVNHPILCFGALFGVLLAAWLCDVLFVWYMANKGWGAIVLYDRWYSRMRRYWLHRRGRCDAFCGYCYHEATSTTEGFNDYYGKF
jgi:hypothetical protein